MDYKDFLLWEQTTRDTIDLKKIYVDVAGDLVSGVLLSQIVYWNLPNSKGKSKLRVIINEELWLAKGREDWWEECRISAKQFDRSIKLLESKGIVTTKLKKFDGAPKKHIKLNLEILIDNINEMLTSCDSLDFTQRGKSNLPKGENPIYPKGKIQFTQKVKSLTETTTETTTETIKQSSSIKKLKKNNVSENENNKIEEDDKNIEIGTLVKENKEINIQDSINYKDKEILEILEHCQLLNFKLKKADVKALLITFCINDILRAITTICNTEAFANGEIKSNKAYLLKVLNDFKTNKNITINNTITNSNNNPKKLLFTDYSQREVEDWNAYENQLLGWE
ncbi:hypothetical protein [Clostridium tarantellae]|uniref:Uncharacterized protein n=1 Tax=Clostridium tarantellae TaxID=39493 RepID=A0A6I1MST0_9CLOT|nr:hypothetical protein [Clostridium tarantellae]MPQ45227.1 hypothetical protein [Clostridium tarantellae]